ncbi:hypothetical protein LJR129_000292 [Acidovorax sp. LjRoot129]|uniref:hypothetical protein n=1 Tax=Acidovorax sp. LjRoot129 TaxID=3342260 RepID=UPI003ECCF94C
MTLARMSQIKCLLEDAGWSIIINNKDLYKVFDDQIIWPIRYVNGEKNLTIVFQLVEDFGNRTESLADLFFFKIDGHEEEFVFRKIKSDQWQETLSQFDKKISSIVANSD